MTENCHSESALPTTGRFAFCPIMDFKSAKKLLIKTKVDYEKIAQGFDETRAGAKHFKEDLKQLISEIKPGESVLDLGSGNGRLYELLVDRGISYLGIDNCEPLIEKARQRFSAAKFLVGDALDLSFLGQEKFDRVYAIALLNHIPGKELRLKVLKNIREVLKPNGLLILTTWNLYQPRYWGKIIKYSILKIIGRVDLDWGDVLVPWHTREEIIYRYYHVFTKKEISRLIDQANFKESKIYYLKNGWRSNWLAGSNLVARAKKI